jgi:ankyrin repeat protein
LEEIGKRNWKYAHRLFQCVAAASRPLRVEELAEFLAFDFDTASTPTFREDWREEDPRHAVRSTCSSLLAIVDDVFGSKVIQSSHFSVKEYLTSKRLAEAKDTISRFHISMTPAHTIVAQACQGVLLHIDEDITYDDLEKFPLAAYAAEHLVSHAQSEGVSPIIQDGMKRLFDPNNHHLAVWDWIYDIEYSHGRYTRVERPSQARATALHYAAFFGLHDIVKFLIIEHSQDVNARGFRAGETSLLVACRKGHSDVARILLEHGAVTETRDDDSWSPLKRASAKGSLEIVQVLLEYGADVSALAVADDEFKETALLIASAYGQTEVARMLLEHGADVTFKCGNYRTPLHDASNEGVALILLEYGADPNDLAGYCRTPLHQALDWGGRAEVARVLLENGADANARDSKNKTPLHVASQEGCLDGARILLQHGADIHARDDDGETPFQVASACRRDNVMQLLLEHGAEDHRTQ